jgi:hypothetical protein
MGSMVGSVSSDLGLRCSDATEFLNPESKMGCWIGPSWMYHNKTVDRVQFFGE